MPGNGDFTVWVALDAVSPEIDALRAKVEAQFKANPIKVTFDSGGAAKAEVAGLTSVKNALDQCQVSVRGLVGVKKLYKAEEAQATAQLKINAAAEIEASKVKLSNMRLENAERQRATATIRQQNASIQTGVNFENLARQAQDYYNRHKDNIQQNIGLSRQWNDLLAKIGDSSKWSGNASAARSAFKILQSESRAAGVEVDTLGQRLKYLFGQHFNTALVMVGINALRRALMELYQNVVDLDKAVVNLQIATGRSRSDVQSLISEYSGLAKELGATTVEVANAADVWLRQGKSQQEANTLIRDTMMLSKLGQIDSAEASKNLTSAMKGYKIEVADAINVVDKLTAVDMEAAASAGGIATAMSETAVGANLAGVSLDKLIGYLTTVIEVTQDSEESVGTFYRTLFSRMGRIKSGELYDPESAESLDIWAVAA